MRYAVKHGGTVTFILILGIYVGKQVLVHKQIIHPIDGQHILNGLDDNVVVHLPVKPGPVIQICRWVEGAGNIWTIINGIICVEIFVEKNVPGALDVVQFEMVVLLQQIGSQSDVAVGEPLVRNVRDGPEV